MRLKMNLEDIPTQFKLRNEAVETVEDTLNL